MWPIGCCKTPTTGGSREQDNAQGLSSSDGKEAGRTARRSMALLCNPIFPGSRLSAQGFFRHYNAIQGMPRALNGSWSIITGLFGSKSTLYSMLTIAYFAPAVW